MTQKTGRIGWTRAYLRYLRDEHASIFGKLLALVAIAYVILPMDLIPDVPLIGWLDDIGVVTMIGAWLTRRVSRYRDAPAGELPYGASQPASR